MARLVNKQFNSPIGLYSQQNIQDVIDRESQMLSNGAVGIDFNNPNVGKPSNLKNSAVLRMLEEEERHGSRTGVKRVAWPPPHETDTNGPHVEQTEGGPRYPPQVSNYQNNNQQPKSHGPLKLDVSSSQSGISSSVSPTSNQSPSGYKAPAANKAWAPVQSPVHTPKQSPWMQNSPQQWQTQYQPTGQQYIENSSYSQQFRAPSQDQYQNLYNQSQNAQYFANPTQYPSSKHDSVLQSSQGQGVPVQGNLQPSKFVEPPPTSITLRSQVPVNQVPSPIFTSQPATTTLKGGKHLRGDLKWPPENVKLQAEEENRLRLELAKGPVCRPRKVQKDYKSFFQQHALNFTYPGYKIPPGTQFYRPE